MNGKCGNTCPLDILHRIEKRFRMREGKRKFYRILFCVRGCTVEFEQVIKRIDIITGRICPCYRVNDPEELFLRLDEYIEELEERIIKLYSC